MFAKVKIELTAPASEEEKRTLRQTATLLSNDETSVEVLPLKGDEVGVEVGVEVVFSMPDARQGDVVDGIAREFRRTMIDYQDMSISFDKSRRGKTKRKKGMTPKQGQYLAFIHYYTKVNGMPPAEADFQRYFQVSPPSVHNMVVALEKSGYIRRTPRKSRSIELLVGRGEIPDLE